MEREDYEQWLAVSITLEVFKYLKRKRLAIMEEIVDTLDSNQSNILKGRVRELDDILTLNNGEAYDRLTTTG